MWKSYDLTLRARPRGFHLITNEVLAAVDDIAQIRVGMLHILIQHTSAALSLNENTDPAVLRDFERFFNRLVVEDGNGYEHTYEGEDDLPAHFKSSLLGASLALPVRDGNLRLGTWQGIYLCEHRNHGGARRLVLTLQGEER